MESPLQSGMAMAAQQSCFECAPKSGTHTIIGAAAHRITVSNMISARLVSKCIVRNSI